MQLAGAGLGTKGSSRWRGPLSGHLQRLQQRPSPPCPGMPTSLSCGLAAPSMPAAPAAAPPRQSWPAGPGAGPLQPRPALPGPREAQPAEGAAQLLPLLRAATTPVLAPRRAPAGSRAAEARRYRGLRGARGCSFFGPAKALHTARRGGSCRAPWLPPFSHHAPSYSGAASPFAARDSAA